jgi:hypothetical protein
MLGGPQALEELDSRVSGDEMRDREYFQVKFCQGALLV